MAKKVKKTDVQIAIEALDEFGPKLLRVMMRRTGKPEVADLIQAVNAVNEIRILLATLEE